MKPLPLRVYKVSLFHNGERTTTVPSLKTRPRFRSAANTVTDLYDVVACETRSIVGLTEASRATGAVVATDHRVDPIAATVATNPRAAAGAICHRAAGVEHRSTATTATGIKALRHAELEFVAAADVARIAKRVVHLDRAPVPGATEPSGVSCHRVTIGIAG